MKPSTTGLAIHKPKSRAEEWSAPSAPVAGYAASIASIGVPREIKPDELRVAFTPDAVRELVGHDLTAQLR